MASFCPVMGKGEGTHLKPPTDCDPFSSATTWRKRGCTATVLDPKYSAIEDLMPETFSYYLENRPIGTGSRDPLPG